MIFGNRNKNIPGAKIFGHHLDNVAKALKINVKTEYFKITANFVFVNL